MLTKLKTIKNKWKITFILGEKIKELIDLFFPYGLATKIDDFPVTFRLEFRFAISDMVKNWGKGHNSGFKKWLEVCKDKKVVFDIGAHIGLYSLPASKVISPEGIIFAFEPAEVNYKLLSKHIKHNGITNIRISPFIVGKENKEEVLFYESKFPTGLHRKFPLKGYANKYKKQVSLDSFCENYNIHPEVMKIDVEGSEIEVLEGAERIIKDYRPIIFLSIHPHLLNEFGKTTNELLDLIKKYGYSLLNMERKKVEEVVHREYLLIQDV
jgi:FkbM family methyltransferase